MQLLQQHINRGLKRHARMTGRDAPSDLELRANLHKRLYIPASGRPHAKRYNRHNNAEINAAVETGEVGGFHVNDARKKGHGAKGNAYVYFVYWECTCI